MKTRIYLLFVIVVGLWIVLLSRAAFLQVLPNEKLNDLKKRERETKIEIAARRGVISDRYGKELAVTLSSYSLFADPKLITHPKPLARRLARLFSWPASDLITKLKSPERRFVWIKRHLSEAELKTLKSWQVRGLGFIEEPRRVYPSDSMAAQLLGFVGTEGKGLEGIELSLDKTLRGESRWVSLPRDARGRPLLANGRVLTDALDGADLQLTIDSELQFVLEAELRRAMQDHMAESASAIVMDAQTSEVLAIGQYPTYNLNEPNRAQLEVRRNRAVTDAFEPGSTTKTFVIAAALKEGLIKPSTQFFCEHGRMKVGDKWISEASPDEKFGNLTVSEILSRSSNIGAAKIAFALGDERLRAHLLDFGFGARTGVSLPGESRGILQKLPWRPHLLSNIGFGHGLSVTPIQLITAYTAIANGGWLKKPLIVKSVSDPEKDEPVTYEAEVVRRVLTAAEASTLTLMLTEATSAQSTGFNARIPGFPVAGKTGTAQKVDFQLGGYQKGSYISSFAGFVPAQSPRFVIYVAVDNPKKKYYGSEVAAPVFARIAQFAVRKAGLPPVLLHKDNLLENSRSLELTQKRALDRLEDVTNDPDFINGKVPKLQGLSLREVYQKLGGSGIQLSVDGSGLVTRSEPAESEPLPNSKQIRLHLSPVQ